MRMKHRTRLGFEQLEDRVTPSWVGIRVGSLALFNQRSFDGSAAASNLSIDGGLITVMDDDGTAVVQSAGITRVILNARSVSEDINIVDNDAAVNPDLTLNLRTGDRAINFDGAADNFWDDVNIIAFGGAQSVDLTGAGGFFTAASLTMSLGTGADSVSAEDFTVTGNVYWSKVNDFTSAGLSTYFVGGNFVINNRTDPENNSILFDNDAAGSSLSVLGNFSYFGGALDDTLDVTLGGGSGNLINGRTTINAGAGTNSSSFDDTTFFGSISYSGGAGEDLFDCDACIFDSSMNFRLGDGTNIVSIDDASVYTAVVARVNVFGGNGPDTIIFEADTAAVANIGALINTGDDDDVVDLNSGSLQAQVVFAFALILTGGGNDSIDLNNATIGVVFINTGADDDMVIANDGSTLGTVRVWLGAGNDDLDIGGGAAPTTITNLIADGGPGTDTLNFGGTIVSGFTFITNFEIITP